MADYDLKYTGQQIDALLDAANELKTNGYIYKGVATPSTNPGTPTERVAYLASEPGTYTNFGGIVIASGLYSLTYAGGTWTGTQMSAGSDIEVVQTTGDSTTDVMSQKAVTDEVAIYSSSSVDYTGQLIWERGSINPNTGEEESANNYRSSAITTDGIFTTIIATNNISVPQMLAARLYNNGTYIASVAIGVGGGNVDISTYNANTIRFVRANANQPLGNVIVSCNIRHVTKLKDKVIDMGKGYSEVSNELFITYDGAFFGANGKYVLASGCAFKYIQVNAGERYIITANSNAFCVYAQMRSIPDNIEHWTDIDATSHGTMPPKKIIVLEIENGCNYLAVGVSNTYINVEPTIFKIDDDKALIDNIVVNSVFDINVNNSRVLLFPVYGQSLAIGGDAVPITTYCRFPNNCANDNTLGLRFDQVHETSIYGLVESYVDFKGQEDRVPAIKQTDRIASFSSGQGSTPISGLVKGTTLYNNLISAITTAYNNRARNAMIIPAFCWVQGEGDTNNGVDYYYNALSQLRVDLDADIKAITGQSEDVHCILYQTNQLCPATNSNWDASKYASGAGGALMEGSVTAQWKLIKDSAYFHASSPVYPMTFVVSSNGAIIHINGMSQKLLGYYEGLATKRLMDGHGNDIGLYVTNVTKVDSTHIRLSLHVPAPPIVVDTESVFETDNYGFSVITESNQNIISNVNIERNNLGSSSILITTSTDCTNAKIRYGVNGIKGHSGYDKGPRGNIRDSQGLWYKADINGVTVPMHNWLLFFEYLIN